MIVSLPDTTTEEISKRLVRLRNEVGAMAMGRVLTLVIDVEHGHCGEAVTAATTATRQHPSRIIVLERSRGTDDRLDAEIRVGGDAGASEVVQLVLHGSLGDHAQHVIIPLLLPDSPVVVWWPGVAPRDVAHTPIGAMAQRRIIDTAACPGPREDLALRAEEYRDGDTDLGWTRITRWRALLAAALDQPPFEQVTAVTVTGGSDSPATDLLAAWLGDRLGCPVRRARTVRGAAVVSVRLERRSGPVDLVRVSSESALLTQPGQLPRRVTLPESTLAQVLADELHRLDPDSVFAHALHTVPRLDEEMTASEAVERGLAPDVHAATVAARTLASAMSGLSSRHMVDADEPSHDASPDEVAAAAEERLEQMEPAHD